MADPLEEIEGLLDRVPASAPLGPPEPDLEFETKWPHRRYITSTQIQHGYSVSCESKPARRTEAEYVSSETIYGQHAPAIDIDMPCRLVPSSTPGHFHLFIEKTMPLRQYKKLLKAMARAGIVEKQFYKMAVNRKATHLRTPNNPKPKRISVIRSIY